MKYQPKVSIILPVYNAVSTISACIESILNQKERNFELIIINDGSTDNTALVCKEYQKLDKRLRVLTQRNAGVSVARDRGIAAAKGVYITFVDADDSLLPDALRNMVSLLEQHSVDCIRTSYQVMQADGSDAIMPVSEKAEPGLYVGDRLDDLRYLAASGGIMCYSWLLLVRRDVMLEEKVTFPKGIVMMEDSLFYVELLSKINSIYLSGDVTYSYNVSPHGATLGLENFELKVRSILKVSELMGQYFSAQQIRSISAVHVTAAVSMLMVRLDRVVWSPGGINLVDTFTSVPGLRSLYHKADMRSVGIYARVAAWAVLGDKKKIIKLLVTLRQLMGKG